MSEATRLIVRQRGSRVGAFATVDNAAVLEGRLAVTGNAVERGLFVAPGSTAIIAT